MMRFVLRAGATWLAYKLAEELFSKRPTVAAASEPGSEAAEPSPEPSQSDLDRVEEMYEDSAAELADEIEQPGTSSGFGGDDRPEPGSPADPQDAERDRNSEKNLPTD